jgi:small subunit ribosomal protein S17
VPSYHLVHDPNNSVRQGDVISIAAGWRASKDVRHIVRHIVAPYGPPIDERPAVPTEQELYETYAAKREAKLARRTARDEERAAAQEAERAAQAERAARWAAAEKERRERKDKKMDEVRSALEHVVD